MNKTNNKIDIDQRVLIDHLDVIISTKKSVSIPREDVIHGDIRKSVHSYVDICYCLFNDSKHNLFGDLERGKSEIKIFVSPAAGKPAVELFYGIIIDDLTLNKVKSMRVVRFVAKSFPILLTKKMLENYVVKYRKGYGEVIKKLVQGFNFNVDGILEDNSQGKVIFDKMSVLDAIRYLAYVKGWCIEFIGKSISFAPCRKPEHTGVTINLEELDSATIHK